MEASKTLEEAITAVREALVAGGSHANFEEINRGYCSDFVDDVYERLGGAEQALALGVTDHDLGQFLTPGEDGHHEGTPFDREMASKHWPGVCPPAGMEWEEIDRLSEFAGFNCGTRVFMAFGGRFYDAEAPGGADRLFDLPFFGRVLESWLSERERQPSA